MRTRNLWWLLGRKPRAGTPLFQPPPQPLDWYMDGLVFLIIIFFSYLFIFLSCRPRLECIALASVAVSILTATIPIGIVIERLYSDGFRLTNEKYIVVCTKILRSF